MRLLRTALLALASLPSFLQAQSTELTLRTRLLHQPLYLRHPWASDNLNFDSAGHLTSSSSDTSFTLSGVSVDSLSLTSTGLVLYTHRVGLEFNKDQPTRVDLKLPNPGGFGKHDEKMVLTLDPPPSGDYGPALDALFTPDLESLVPMLPYEWQSFAHKNLLHEPPPDSTPDREQARSRRIGGAVTAPRVLKMPEPQFNDAARGNRYSGNVLIYLQVDTNGDPTHVRILRPIGLGLDEKAVQAVQAYKFDPALENGNPVTVEMNVEVNFRIF